jgi:hypothetical protein
MCNMQQVSGNCYWQGDLRRGQFGLGILILYIPNLIFMVPYILVIYVQLKVQLDVLIMYYLFLSIS